MSWLKMRQSWIISTNEKPLCFIAFSIISAVPAMSFELHLATKEAPAERAILRGFIGAWGFGKGRALLLKPSWLVGVG